MQKIKNLPLVYCSVSIGLIILLIVIEHFVLLYLIDSPLNIIFCVASVLFFIYTSVMSWFNRAAFSFLVYQKGKRNIQLRFIAAFFILAIYISLHFWFVKESDEFRGQPFLTSVIRSPSLTDFLRTYGGSYEKAIKAWGLNTVVTKIENDTWQILLTRLIFFVVYISFAILVILSACRITLLIFRKIEIDEVRKMGNKIVKIFLASSSELKTERKEFREFISIENDRLAKQGIYIQIVQWEYFIDAMSKTRLQDEYNLAVGESDIFVSLFFKKVGRYTEEEFDKAFGEFKKNGKPLIYTYFKDVKQSEEDGSKSNREMFKIKLSKLGHYPTVYTSTADLHLQFRRQLDNVSMPLH